MSLHLLFILQQLLDFVRVRNMSSLLHPRPASHAVLPSLESGKFVYVNTRPPGRVYPAPMRDVSDSAFLAY